MRDFRLCLILDSSICGKRFLFDIAKKAIRAGVDVIQLRDKESSTKEIIRKACLLKKLTKGKALFIINDRVDIARAVEADGVHLGQDDLPISFARSILGKRKIIGVSCHNLKQAHKAQKEGADYISLGPLFSTPLKPRYKPIGLKLIRKVVKRGLEIPWVVIGGINISNLKQLLTAGARRVALCRAVLKAKDVYLATKTLKDLLNSSRN